MWYTKTYMFYKSGSVSITETEVCIYGVSLQETEEFECWVEPASGVWTVGHVDSTHLITGPCVCIVMLDNGPAAVACQQEM